MGVRWRAMEDAEEGKSVEKWGGFGILEERLL